jgi:hypothetical protein
MCIAPNYLCMNLKSFRRTKYYLNVNNCIGEKMSSPCDAVSEDSNLFHSSVAVNLPKLNIMCKNLFRKYERRKMQSIFSVPNYSLTNQVVPCYRYCLI